MNRELLISVMDLAKSVRILYVEDNEEARITTLELLETVFLDIDTAVDGLEAFDMFNTNKYDLVLTDINMPRLNGIELITKIREVNISIPILILSGHSDTDYFLESIKLGVDGYLLKPLEIDQFLAVSLKVLKRIEMEHTLKEYQDTLEEKVEAKTRELKFRCLHEYYTDLPNSIMLQKDLGSGEFDYMILLDMSHFATINKEYGKEFANHVIVRTARTLEYHIHKNAKLYKVESDRFVILLKDTRVDKVHDFCLQLVAFFDTKNIKVDDAELHITFNIGVSKIQDDISDTLINSEYALDKSKKLGSRHYEIFDENEVTFSGEKDAIKWLRRTREMIFDDKIEPYFQPIKNISTQQVLKYEVLARGIVEDKVISPYYFIAAAEKLGLITSITRMMINKSFEFFKDKEYDFSINITERDLLEGYLVDFLNEKLSFYGIASSRVTFEILENITIAKNTQKITQQLNILREMGFSIAIDDFGIENSNFSRLLEINLDFIKIDGIFIKNLKNNAKNRTITRAIVNLSKTLGIQTVAEYVEDEDIYNIVKECGIDFAQGYYVGKPEAVLLSHAS